MSIRSIISLLNQRGATSGRVANPTDLYSALEAEASAKYKNRATSAQNAYLAKKLAQEEAAQKSLNSYREASLALQSNAQQATKDNNDWNKTASIVSPLATIAASDLVKNGEKGIIGLGWKKLRNLFGNGSNSGNDTLYELGQQAQSEPLYFDTTSENATDMSNVGGVIGGSDASSNLNAYSDLGGISLDDVSTDSYDLSSVDVGNDFSGSLDDWELSLDDLGILG